MWHVTELSSAKECHPYFKGKQKNTVLIRKVFAFFLSIAPNYFKICLLLESYIEIYLEWLSRTR